MFPPVSSGKPTRRRPFSHGGRDAETHTSSHLLLVLERPTFSVSTRKSHVLVPLLMDPSASHSRFKTRIWVGLGVDVTCLLWTPAAVASAPVLFE